MQAKTLLQTDHVRARIMPLAPGEQTAFHHHSDVTDHIVCLHGNIDITLGKPPENIILKPGGYCLIETMRPHRVANASATEEARYLLLQGVGKYDFIIEEK